MLDVLAIAQQRLTCASAPVACAVATIVATQGSVPRPVGTSMLVGADGSLHGSLSGGCVEGAVLEACQEAMETGDAAVHRFGFSEEDAFAVGLMCGGSLDVLVQPFTPPSAEDPEPARELLGPTADGRPPAAYVAQVPRDAAPPLAALVPGAGPDEVRRSLAPLLPGAQLADAVSQVAGMIREGRTGTIRLAPQNRSAPRSEGVPPSEDTPAGEGARPSEDAPPSELFVESRTRPAHLVVLGANAFGQALVEAARPLRLRITLCDPRPAFTDPASFPGAEVVRAWPHRFLADAAQRGDLDPRSMICVLTHDPKVDVPALSAALELDVAYVGAMGSRRSDRDRRAALREAGVGEEALARLRSPIGLDLGADTPAEVAVSILAEILAVRAARGTVEPLRDGSGPLHVGRGPRG
ncbi:XdhC family protein [uncultured Brachybacterium sp.]|uniref:XdhC family protein n=1 Tax=uncultured Brachybacterium sp. TaxID=189680 RepID=UPI002626FBA1|nr:XdhC/CoxI family protein [uncultured Brachybacterium sp.]